MQQFAHLEKKFEKLITAVRLAGGRFVFVGGCVRDILLGLTPKDIDAEVYGLSYEALAQALSVLGQVSEVGKQFGVLKVGGFDIDIALPRFDEKIGKGHRGFSVKVDYSISFAQSAKRRDLTINAIGYAVDKKTILDPYNGVKDLQNGILRSVSDETFGEDPLRALRVAQFTARFRMQPTESLAQLCSGMPISELPQERIAAELRKILFMGQKPSIGFEFLKYTKLMFQCLPVLSVLTPEKELDLFKCLDSKALQEHRTSPKYPLYAMVTFAYFLPHHNRHSAVDTFLISEKQKKKTFLLLQQLDRYGQMPEIQKAALYWSGYALREQDLSWHDLISVLHIILNQTPYLRDLRQKVCETGALNAQLLEPVVTGEMLIEKGLVPSPKFQNILHECLRIQFEQGIRDPDQILKQIL